MWVGYIYFLFIDFDIIQSHTCHGRGLKMIDITLLHYLLDDYYNFILL